MQTPDIQNLLSNFKLSKTKIFFILLSLLLVLIFSIIISPFILIGFIFYYLYELINKIHCRNTNFKFDTKN